MPKWKLQAVTPDTCEPPKCKYIEMYDVLSPPPRVMTVVAFERVCPGHAATVPIGVMLWQDGNWKNLAAYIAYQRKWFRRLNHVEWLVNHPDEEMPSGIAAFTSDPVTPGSVSAPPQVEIDNMNQAYNQNREHNRWKNVAVSAIRSELGDNEAEATWIFTGVGDARTVTVGSSELSVPQRNNVRSVMDIQFGLGKIEVVNQVQVIS